MVLTVPYHFCFDRLTVSLSPCFILGCSLGLWTNALSTVHMDLGSYPRDTVLLMAVPVGLTRGRVFGAKKWSS